MCEVCNYLFGSLRTSERAVKTINRTLKKQMSFNKQVTVFALAATVYAATMHLCVADQSRRIKKLSVELKELERKKGE